MKKNIFSNIIYKYKSLSICTLLLSIHFSVTSQTVNLGELVITDKTILSTVSVFNNAGTGSLINDGDIYVYSDWNNDGSVDFLGDTGIIRFKGNNPQAITGANFSYFFNVLFDNASAQIAFELSGAISVGNESTFKNGIIDNNNFGGEFVFEPNANHNLTSNNSYVNGQVTKIGNDSFVFPIGDAGYYRFAGIEDIDLETEIFSSNYFFENATINYPSTNFNVSDNLEIIDTKEYWTVEPISGDSKALVSLSWNAATTSPEILVEPYELIHIARWDELLQKWVDEGGIVDADNNTVTAEISGYGVFTLARATIENYINISNAFTPNGDGKNDLFEIPQLLSISANFEMTIVNRFGNTVYQYKHNGDKNSIPRWWDGSSNGRLTVQKSELVPTGVYYYSVEFNDGKTKPIVGWVYLNK